MFGSPPCWSERFAAPAKCLTARPPPTCCGLSSRIRLFFRDWRTAAVLLATFGLTLVRDLTSGILAGCVLAALFAILKRGIPEEGA